MCLVLLKIQDIVNDIAAATQNREDNERKNTALDTIQINELAAEY
jgi:hypothetical protein